jgi:hypothetical protein
MVLARTACLFSFAAIARAQTIDARKYAIAKICRPVCAMLKAASTCILYGAYRRDCGNQPVTLPAP